MSTYSFAYLNDASAGFSGKNYHNGLWFWTRFGIALALNEFDWTNPVHGVAFYLGFLALPFGVLWNTLNVLCGWITHRKGPVTVEFNQFQSLIVVIAMWIPGLCVTIKYWNPDDAIWRYVFTTALDCLLFKTAFFYVMWRCVKADVFVWPDDPGATSRLFDYWASWLGLGCYQSALWILTEVLYMAKCGSLDGRSIHVFAVIEFILLILGAWWFISSVLYNWNYHPIKMPLCFTLYKVMLSAVYIVLGFFCVGIGLAKQWNITDPVSIFVAVMTWDCLIVKLTIVTLLASCAPLYQPSEHR